MKVIFSDGAADFFVCLPGATQARALKTIRAIQSFPEMFPVRQRGILKRYRFFTIDRYVFGYSVSSTEIRIVGIVPGAMRDA